MARHKKREGVVGTGGFPEFLTEVGYDRAYRRVQLVADDGEKMEMTDSTLAWLYRPVVEPEPAPEPVVEPEPPTGQYL